MRWLLLLSITTTGCQTLLWPTPRAEETTAVDATETDDLAMAAKCLGRGDEAAAVPHLASVVRANPEQVMFRAQLAELLYRLDRDAESRHHFERFVSAAQGTTGPPRKHLVHCHTRLMELARRSEDGGEELFHKGVGLLLLASQPDSGEDAGFLETVLCQAAKSLEEAKALRPNDPRVRLYLGDAYDRMGSKRGAEREWNAARQAAVPGTFTPAELRRLNERSPEK